MTAINTLSLTDLTPLSINKKEVMRYLGVREENENTDALISQSEAELFKIATPKASYVLTDITVDENTVDFGFMRANSQKLAKNLQECDQAYVFCATLGIAVDRLFERQSKISQAKAMVLSATASSLIESFCDYLNNELVKDKASRPRFSCGYGDFCLEHQADILRVLEADKRLGVCLTDSYMMVPVKTVTAIIGIRR